MDQTRLKKRKASRQGRFVFCCALLLGLALVLLIPPFTSPDELIHFQNAWAIGHGQAFTGAYWSEGQLKLPSGFAPLMKEYPVRLIGITNTEKCSWERLWSDNLAYNSSGGLMMAQGRIFSLGYLFSALGMALGSAFSTLFGIGWLESPYCQLLLGRFCNWIFYVLVCRAACRKTQSFQNTLFMLACMPMSLFLGATLNYDAILIPTCLWFVAEILSLSSRRPYELSTAAYTRLLLCVLLMAGTKAPYVCLALLLFLLPGTKAAGTEKGPKRVMLLLLAAFIGFALSTVPYLVPVGGAVGYAGDQISWLLGHPLSLPGIILKTLWTDARAIGISFWGCFGWLDVHVPRMLTVVGWLALIGVTAFECWAANMVPLKGKRFLGLIVSVLIYCILVTLQYVSHAPKVNGHLIGGDHSIGFQGRYLIPCFLPFAMTFVSCREHPKRVELIPAAEHLLKWFCPLWGIVCYLAAALTLLNRYWI